MKFLRKLFGRKAAPRPSSVPRGIDGTPVLPEKARIKSKFLTLKRVLNFDAGLDQTDEGDVSFRRLVDGAIRTYVDNTSPVASADKDESAFDAALSRIYFLGVSDVSDYGYRDEAVRTAAQALYGYLGASAYADMLDEIEDARDRNQSAPAPEAPETPDLRSALEDLGRNLADEEE